MRILVTAASKHGATSEIADRLAAGLAQRGHEVEVRRPEAVGDPAAYDAAVVGAAVYAGNWLGPARTFVETHAPALRELPLWLFSSGPIGAPDPKPHGDPKGVPELVESLGARAHVVFAGKIDRTLLSLAERAIVRAGRAEEGDFRDWTAIDAWAAQIADELAGARAA